MIFTLMFSTTGDAPEIETRVIYHNQIQGQFFCNKETSIVSFEIDDTDEHTLHTIGIKTSGKTSDHTHLDLQGNIIHDSHVKIESIDFNGIDVTEIFCDGCVCYSHNNNSTSEWHTEPFYGYIGCNGSVDLEFSTPLYRWFLDNSNR